MIAEYTSRYGKIVKCCPGLHEYWLHGKLIARGRSLSSANPEEKPTSEDWAFCYSLAEQAGETISGGTRQMEGEKTMEEQKYIVYQTWGGDVFDEYFDDLSDADAYARDQWYHLTPKARKTVELYVGVIKRENLTEDAFDEETGEIDWSFCNGWDVIDDGSVFNADIERARERAEELARIEYCRNDD